MTDKQNTDLGDWLPISWDTIPSRADLEIETIDLIENHVVTNADRMRNRIREKRKLIVKKATGNWNSDPSSKFVNEHAFILNYLVQGEVLIPLGDKEYRLDPAALERWRALDRRPGQIDES